MVERRDAVQPDIKEKKQEMKAAKAVYKSAKNEYEALYERIEKDTPRGEEVVKTQELLDLEEIYHRQKQAYRDAHFAYKDARKLKRDKEAIEEFIVPEQEKWETPKMQVRLALAQAITAVDKKDVVATDVDFSAVALPDLTDWTAKLAARKYAKRQAALIRRGKIEAPVQTENVPADAIDADILAWADKKADRQRRSLQALIKRTALRYRIMQKLSKLFFRNGLEHDYEEAYKRELEVQCFTKEEKRAQNKRIRAAQFKYNRFASAYKLYIECEQVILDYNDRNNFFDHILGMYEDSVAEAARIDREEEEKARAEKAAKDAEIAAIKLERRIRKDAKKDAKAHGATFDEAYLEQFKTDHAADYEEPTTAVDEIADAEPTDSQAADQEDKEGSDNED